MIQPQTYLTVTDNTGVKKLMCICILGNNRKYGKIGDIIIGVVKSVLPNMLIKRSNIVRAVIVRTKHVIKRLDGLSIKFEDNAVILIHSNNNPQGTRIFGPIARELRDKNFLKIISLASIII